MEDLPSSVTARLRELIYDERAVAYLKLDSAFRLVGAGGRLDHYELNDLRLGEPAAEQALFLEGLLPLAETPCLFPSVEMARGRAADLHLHEEANAVWVILLDVTEARDAVRRMQQRAYEMTLLQEKEALLNRSLAAANTALTAAHQELVIARDAAREALRKKEIDLEGARTLQLALAPPTYRGLVGSRAVTVNVVLEPAREVGGDLVDHLRIDNDLLALVLGDVSDKGAAAALMMARTHALFRGLAARPDASALFRVPEEAVRSVNTTLSQGNPSLMFVTLLIAVFDGATNRLTYVRAGHVPPFLRRTNGAVERLEASGGIPLGIIEDAEYESAIVELRPGDELLIVTDGVTEAMDPFQALFGESRVLELVAGGSARGGIVLQNLLTQVRAFEAGGPQSDDIAAILLRLER